MVALIQRDKGDGVTPARMLRFFGLWVQKKSELEEMCQQHELFFKKLMLLIHRTQRRFGLQLLSSSLRIIVVLKTKEKRLLDKELKRFPLFFKLWLKLGQLEERLGHLEHSLANLEEKSNGLRKARALFARSKNPLSHENWLVTIRAESKHGNKKEADSYITKALQKKVDKARTWLKESVILVSDTGTSGHCTKNWSCSMAISRTRRRCGRNALWRTQSMKRNGKLFPRLSKTLTSQLKQS
ncbi:hypothetical protein WN944_023396 [Citrus x changshan-huyou]|uniref:Uncharacterized protein n=1 Tax=Citrus x changshan-huyou TaxID=2935761 RepID=A0AAP0QWY0_9ROSI